MIRVMLLQCHHAEVSEGRLYISGGGWTTRKGAGPWALAIKVEADLQEVPQSDKLRIECLTREGQPMGYADGGDPIIIEFKLDQPAWDMSSPDKTLAEIMGAVVLLPNAMTPGKYMWRVSWGDEHRPEWDFMFTAEEAVAVGRPEEIVP
jgi:hypothetical protein